MAYLKLIIGIILMLFAIIWLVLANAKDNKENSEHCLTRAAIFTAAALLSILMD
jgi:hypothetical protein